MLFHLLFMSLVGQGLSVENFGKDFITAFPENIASYHPQASSNMLQITAFYTDTTVSITFNRTNVYNENLQSGQTKVVHFPTYVEQYQFKRSFYSVRINSSKLIVVLWISQRGDSVQSSVVQPVKNLGMQYSIPFINYNQMLASLYSRPLDNWRCIIINAGSIINTIFIQTVSMKAQRTFNFTLRPYELYQFQTNGSEIKVYSNNTVAVLLTHPCAETSWCVCNMVTNHVLPENLWGQTFVVPSVKNLNSTWLQVTSTTSLTLRDQKIPASNSDLISFPYLESGPQLITASNNVSIRLISPGFILELMPESMFAACFLLQVNSTGTEVLIIAETANRGDVYVDAGLLSSTDWKTVANSKYSSVSVSLRGTHIIWHPASRIGVYMFEKMESGIPYGGPAVILNEDPDRDGCMADPALYKTTTDVMTWPESHDYCLNATLQLSIASSARAQRDMTSFLLKDVGPRYFWIGLRRSLLTLEWYWKNGNNSEYSVNYTKWADGHQETPWKSLCASVSQDANKDFSWKSVPCCSKMRPVCYKKALYFSDLTFDSLDNHFYIVNQTVCPLYQCNLSEFDFSD